MADTSEWTDWLVTRIEIAADELGLVLTGTYCQGLSSRTLGVAVRQGNHAPGWLRVVADRLAWADGPAWHGNVAASALSGVARPEVLAVREWDMDGGRVRAELMDMAPSPALSTEMIPTHEMELDPSWWASLRRSLAHLADHETDRVCVDADFLRRRISAQLGIAADFSAVQWSTAHGDLHWANLTGPHCWLLDWEAWGTAPAGYDVALLLTVSLLRPDLAAEIRSQYECELSGQSGYVAQLAAAGKMLELSQRGHYPRLVTLINDHVHRLVQAVGHS